MGALSGQTVLLEPRRARAVLVNNDVTGGKRCWWCVVSEQRCAKREKGKGWIIETVECVRLGSGECYGMGHGGCRTVVAVEFGDGSWVGGKRNLRSSTGSALS